MDAFDAVDKQYHRSLQSDDTIENVQPRIRAWLNHLSNDPLLQSYCQHTQGGSSLNTRPEHAFGERLQAVFTCLLAAQGKIDVSCDEAYSNPRLVACGIASMLMQATVYLWSDKMEHVADAAPLPTHTVSRSVLPFPLMFWSRETRYESGDGWSNNWIALVHHTDHCFFVGDSSNRQREDVKLNVGTFRYGGVWPNDYKGDNDLGRLLKRCAFLSSPYVVTERRRLPHHIRRQLERDHGERRENLQEEMHVVNLRRTQIRKPQQHEGDKPTVEWKHQWWVSAHYRAQWYPSEKAHKVKWIAPYLKGPEDKPVLEKLYAVTR